MDYKAILVGTVFCALTLQGCVAIKCYQCEGLGEGHYCRDTEKVEAMTPVTCTGAGQDRCYKAEFGDKGVMSRGCLTKAECEAYHCDNEKDDNGNECTFAECCTGDNCNSAVTNSVSALALASVAILAVVEFK